MSAPLASPAVASRPVPVRRGCQFELAKLAVQWRIRLLLLACWVGPAVVVAVIARQGSLPTDTVFGRWLGQTGWAAPLVVLSFAGSWALPLSASLVAGDVFAVEDRLGTWPHLLVAVRSPRRIFAAKALASLSVVLLLVAGLAVSASVGGLVASGSRSLAGLDGRLLTPSEAAVAVLLAWVAALAPALAFASVGLLGSVAFGRSPTGMVMPPLLAVLLQVAQLLPLPVAVRVALPSYGFIAWRGLFTHPAQTGPLLAGTAVGLLWAVVGAALAYRMFTRRAFADQSYDGAAGRVLLGAALPLAAVLVATVATVAVTAPGSGPGIDAAKLERSLATTFAHLYRLQTAQLHRPDVTEAQLQTGASCQKGAGADVGAGNDWRCVVTWRIPGATATGSAVYQLDVTPDGRYVADGDGPQAVNGSFQVRTPTGDVANPLWEFDGLVDLLAPVSKE